jgi:hypothetical protein
MGAFFGGGAAAASAVPASLTPASVAPASSSTVPPSKEEGAPASTAGGVVVVGVGAGAGTGGGGDGGGLESAGRSVVMVQATMSAQIEASDEPKTSFEFMLSLPACTRKSPGTRATAKSSEKRALGHESA